MRKIPRIYENQFDNITIDFGASLCPFFHSLNFTPNGITTLSLIFGIVSLYFLFQYKILLFAITYYISYLFDCMDGYYARKYKMVSKGGDLYDHIKDATVNILLLIILWFKYPVDNKTRIIVLILIIIFFTLMCSHLGCQEKIYPKDESSTLDFTQYLCPGNPKNTIKITRIFGCGTWCFIIILLVVFLNYKRLNKS